MRTASYRIHGVSISGDDLHLLVSMLKPDVPYATKEEEDEAHRTRVVPFTIIQSINVDDPMEALNFALHSYLIDMEMNQPLGTNMKHLSNPSPFARPEWKMVTPPPEKPIKKSFFQRLFRK